ncbi:MAG: putative DNA modification/repair radical SAM protein [Endomicrobiia bacterium]
MDISLKDKLNKLTAQAVYDISCSACSIIGRKKDPTDRMHKWIYPAVLPDGQTIPILKILLTNLCSNKCKYCVVSTNRVQESTSFRSDELAKVFISMFQKKLVKGIFLSSGIGVDANKTMDEMIKTAEIIRNKYFFKGYIHLKILPGVTPAHIEKAIQLADRISINLEAPSAARLNKIAESKNFNSLIQSIQLIDKILARYNQNASHNQFYKRKTQTTQFVVGAADESDKEILLTVSELYKKYNLWRAYFSAFQPIEGTPLENHSPVPLLREHRLYQADFLLRKYNFKFDEIFFDKDGNLPFEKDPKTVWALNHLEMFPLEINKADYSQLIRVPGIGPISAKRIISLRRKNKFRSLEELKQTGAVIERARDFLLFDGRFFKKQKQIELELTM